MWEGKGLILDSAAQWSQRFLDSGSHLCCEPAAQTPVHDFLTKALSSIICLCLLSVVCIESFTWLPGGCLLCPQFIFCSHCHVNDWYLAPPSWTSGPLKNIQKRWNYAGCQNVRSFIHAIMTVTLWSKTAQLASWSRNTFWLPLIYLVKLQWVQIPLPSPLCYHHYPKNPPLKKTRRKITRQ